MLGHGQVNVAAKDTAGRLQKKVDDYFEERHDSAFEKERATIRIAIRIRNRIAHDSLYVGFSWLDYRTGGGHWEPVISLLGGDLYDEFDLSVDLLIQREATRAALLLLSHVEDWDKAVREHGEA